MEYKNEINWPGGETGSRIFDEIIIRINIGSIIRINEIILIEGSGIFGEVAIK